MYVRIVKLAESAPGNVFCQRHELCYSQQIFMQPNAFLVIGLPGFTAVRNVDRKINKGI